MIFVDTGAFLARHLKHDQFHRLAYKCWKEIEKRHEACSTSNFVLDETFTLLARRTTYTFASERARLLLSSRVLTIFRPDVTDEREAIELFRKFGDQKVSFTDCVSFVLMRRNRVERAFSFDRHFGHAGFELWPSRRNG